MSERDMVRRDPPPEHIQALPYGPKRQIHGDGSKTIRFALDQPVVEEWTSSEGYRLGRWLDGDVFRYMERLW